MRSRIAQLLEVDEEDDHQDDWTDVTFLLDDGSHLDCHQLILKMASPFFELKFGRRWNRSSSQLVRKPKVKVEGVASETFRLMVEFIYKSGSLADKVLKPEQLWQLLEAADMYLLSGLVAFCTQKLSDHLRDSGDERELVTMVKQARRLPIFEEVSLNLRFGHLLFSFLVSPLRILKWQGSAGRDEVYQGRVGEDGDEQGVARLAQV